MNESEPDRERLTLTMTALDDGLKRITQKYRGIVRFFYEDPEAFGAGHFVYYPENDTRSRFAIEEQYNGTDWSDDERLPTSWTWVAEREVRQPDGRYVWGVERRGEAQAEGFWQVLVEAENWARRTQNRSTQTAQFGVGHDRGQQPPAPRL